MGPYGYPGYNFMGAMQQQPMMGQSLLSGMTSPGTGIADPSQAAPQHQGGDFKHLLPYLGFGMLGGGLLGGGISPAILGGLIGMGLHKAKVF